MVRNVSLVDITGCFGTQEVMEAIKEAAEMAKPHIKASAVAVIIGLQRHLLS